ncbi:uncharacterized protein NPIL_392381 [Nephila pilipes]|uniref:Leucine-rich repeat-containing protein n=1 Tax=Nephila pilipes TaxID=299642 RepID=A0A8X6N8K6_NEPPI|nr:uncharacterized protein NPIL_392381 [Nephila pilipes]
MAENIPYKTFGERKDDVFYENLSDLAKLEIYKGMKKRTSLRLYSGNGVDLLPHACQYLCCLKSLYISDSHLESLRFLGAYFSKLKELTLVDCGLRSLDGITSFPNLKILRLPGNEIRSVDQCIYLPQLCHLDVQRNLISNLQSLEWLMLCPKLVSLVLLHNPLYFLTKDDQPPYTEEDVIKLLPKLKYIDGRPLDPVTQKLKKFRKWMMPKQTKAPENYSKISNDTISEDTTPVPSPAAGKSPTLDISSPTNNSI